MPRQQLGSVAASSNDSESGILTNHADPLEYLQEHIDGATERQVPPLGLKRPDVQFRHLR